MRHPFLDPPNSLRNYNTAFVIARAAFPHNRVETMIGSQADVDITIKIRIQSLSHYTLLEKRFEIKCVIRFNKI